MAESFEENNLEKGPEFNYENYKAEKIIYSTPFILGFMISLKFHSWPVAAPGS